MADKLYNTYSYGEDLTLIEIDRKTIKNKEYLLLLQKQEPNLLIIAFFEDDKLQMVKNKVICGELMKVFIEDEKSFYEKIKPFIDFNNIKHSKKAN
jgi:hypothetical protein